MSDGYSAQFALGQYPARFHREGAPVWLACVVNARGVAAPAMSGTRWCEIGCGQGLDTLIFAAANPGMEFCGIDADPDHIAAARALAEAARIPNARFVCADFRSGAALADLPESFDFIVAHGIYSWVAPDVQQAIRQFAGTRLAPGGVLMIQYMAQPGAALFAALRGLMIGLGGPDMGIAERLAILRDMADAGAGFFAEYPRARSLVLNLSKEAPEFVAHEYMGASVSSFTAREMLAVLGAEGLSYIGSARPVENYDTVSLPAQVQPLVAAQRDPGLRENLRDIARNQNLRYDIYIHTPVLLAARARWQAVAARRFLPLAGLPAPGNVTFHTGIGPVDGGADIFVPILEAFARGPVDYATLMQMPVFGGQAGVVEQALMMLMDAGAIHPMLPTPADSGAAQRLNRLLAPAGQTAGVTVDPLIGSARIQVLPSSRAQSRPS